jgi:hypothetical protein
MRLSFNAFVIVDRCSEISQVLRPDGQQKDNAYFAVQRLVQAAAETVSGLLGDNMTGALASGRFGAKSAVNWSAAATSSN